MGIITKGILGGFAGTVGTVIGGSWKGIDYMRSRPNRRSGTVTPAQEAQQARFALAIRFIQPLAALLMLTFRNYAVRMTGTNNAVSYLLKNAITGTFPNFSIDYSLVLVSRGDLPNAENPMATAPGSGDVKFSWTNNAGVGIAKDSDKAILVVYCPEMRLAVYTTGSNKRSTLDETIDATVFVGKIVHTYIGFISEDGKEIASSIYTGQLTVS